MAQVLEIDFLRFHIKLHVIKTVVVPAAREYLCSGICTNAFQFHNPKRFGNIFCILQIVCTCPNDERSQLLSHERIHWIVNSVSKKSDCTSNNGFRSIQFQNKIIQSRINWQHHKSMDSKWNPLQRSTIRNTYIEIGNDFDKHMDKLRYSALSVWWMCVCCWQIHAVAFVFRNLLDYCVSSMKHDFTLYVSRIPNAKPFGV